MGNNKGRSKGCKTCLQRRVKCDQNRPKCLRCSKSNFVCQGYRETLFIDAREQVLRRLDSTSTSHLPKSNSLPDAIENSRPDLRFPEKTTKVPHAASSHRTSHLYSLVPGSVMRENQFVSYLVANLGGPMKIICHDLVAPSYGGVSSQTSARNQCFLALATTFYGVSHAHQSLMHEGRRLYLRALEAVNAILSNSSGSRIIDALGSVAALCLHEAVAPTRSNEHSWMHHMYGLEQLFALQGPISVLRNSISSALLDVTRPMMIVAALYARRPSLMAHSEWSAATERVANEEDHYSSGSGLGYLLDGLAQISVLYHMRDEIALDQSGKCFAEVTSRTGSCYPPTTAQTLLDRSLSLRHEIFSQRTHWKFSHPNSEFLTSPRTSFPSSQPYPCSVAIHFSSLEAANAFTFHNAVSILINQFIISIYLLLQRRDGDMGAEVSASEQISVAIMNILMSIDYHLPFTDPSVASNLGTPGARNIYLLLPLRLAHKALPQSESPQSVCEKLWLEDVLSLIKSRAMPWMSNDQIFGAE